METKQRAFLIIAAALASSMAVDAEAHDGAPGLDPAASGALRTSDGYVIRVERMLLDTASLEFDVAGEEVDEEPRADGAPRVEVIEEEYMTATLRGVFIEGRVYDASGEARRVPEEGLGISGTLPLDVTVRRAHGAPDQLAVEFGLPEHFLNGVDWSAGADDERG